jgi:hypothetical protein
VVTFHQSTLDGVTPPKLCITFAAILLTRSDVDFRGGLGEGMGWTVKDYVARVKPLAIPEGACNAERRWQTTRVPNLRFFSSGARPA